jgi:AAA+ superfamily predicted ATPase
MQNNYQDYLRDELDRIDRVVLSLFDDWKKNNTHVEHDFMGLCITDEEIEAIISQASPPPGSTDLPGDTDSQTDRSDTTPTADRTSPGRSRSRIVTLASLFGLSPVEVDILLLCLASELDLKYEKIYAYLQNDVTKKRPTVDLVSRILFQSAAGRLQARDYFAADAPLMRNRLLWCVPVDHQMQVPLLSQSLKVDERIIRYLTGSDVCDERLVQLCKVVMPEKTLGEFLSDNQDIGRLALVTRWHQENNLPAVMYFYGPAGTGKRHVAEAICRDLEKKMLVADSRALNEEHGDEMLLLILREAMLQDAAVYFTGFDQFPARDTTGDRVQFFTAIDRFPGWVFIGASIPYEPPAVVRIHRFYRQEFRYPSYELRKKVWEGHLLGQAAPDVDIPALATAFRFSGGQIQDAIRSAEGYAAAKNPGHTRLAMDDLFSGCKAQSNKNLSAFARAIRPVYHWDDIVLPADVKTQLQEICDYIRYRDRVYSDWGFEKKISLGKGLNILFTGPSGTGKTMAAEIIAAEAGLDLYKIDLSSVVSKYIGETEKNLKNVFSEAETSNAILFFDEADALFGKRSEVRDAHDRYANIEINYLLQKMEESEGVVILASNFPKNIDEAFRRRMHFAVEFSQPEREQREEIWRRVFPKQTPVAGDIDYPFLSGFKITGGNIRNIALNAAFLAAADSGAIAMRHIIRATRREFQKTGKLCVKDEFGPYYQMIEGDTL